MADEMLCCDIDQFLHHYAPFVPSKRSVDDALQKMKHEGLLCDDKWWDFSGDDIPFKTGKIETEAFKKLEDIVEALMGQECSGTDHKGLRKCNLKYHNCGDTHVVGEIPGSTFRINGYFSPKYSPTLSKSTKVVVSQVAVAAEFQNRLKMVSAVNQIMNDDPRRMWMYGVSSFLYVLKATRSFLYR